MSQQGGKETWEKQHLSCFSVGYNSSTGTVLDHNHSSTDSITCGCNSVSPSGTLNQWQLIETQQPHIIIFILVNYVWH